jgi:hypothetical protein
MARQSPTSLSHGAVLIASKWMLNHRRRTPPFREGCEESGADEQATVDGEQRALVEIRRMKIREEIWMGELAEGLHSESWRMGV